MLSHFIPSKSDSESEIFEKKRLPVDILLYWHGVYVACVYARVWSVKFNARRKYIFLACFFDERHTHKKTTLKNVPGSMF